MGAAPETRAAPASPRAFSGAVAPPPPPVPSPATPPGPPPRTGCRRRPARGPPSTGPGPGRPPPPPGRRPGAAGPGPRPVPPRPRPGAGPSGGRAGPPRRPRSCGRRGPAAPSPPPGPGRRRSRGRTPPGAGPRPRRSPRPGRRGAGPGPPPAPAGFGTPPAGLLPAGRRRLRAVRASRTARPPSRAASAPRTAGTGAGRAAAVARDCWASVTRRSSCSRASAISRHTARATAVNGVRGGTSRSGRPRRAQASTRAAGTVS